ncbi:hypothetical protein HPB50_007917 [Hyalomma asiaticum]|uniref:Uncharacterized protein n=1 Tax=Hyalomma asiaticum TaxID=266040 RepID=A0ACB7TGW1_HYAAI|nr:hypothetical protein HPB50_007917 [Hyalomma asiaticum]
MYCFLIPRLVFVTDKKNNRSNTEDAQVRNNWNGCDKYHNIVEIARDTKIIAIHSADLLPTPAYPPAAAPSDLGRRLSRKEAAIREYEAKQMELLKEKREAEKQKRIRDHLCISLSVSTLERSAHGVSAWSAVQNRVLSLALRGGGDRGAEAHRTWRDRNGYASE